MSGQALITLSASGQTIGNVVAFVAEGVSNFSTYFPRLEPAWLESRMEVISSQGWVTNTPWPTYEETDERYAYLWYKEGVVGHPLTPADLLRWDAPGIDERLVPSLTEKRHKEYVFEVKPNTLQAGTAVPYAVTIDSGQGPPGPDFFSPATQIDPIRRQLIQPTDEFRASISAQGGLWLGEIASKGTKTKVRVSKREVASSLGMS